jgi:putative membrane protein
MTRPGRLDWLPTPHRITLAGFAVLLAWTWWRPIYPVEQALHHSLTLLAVAALLVAQRRLRLAFAPFALIVAFLALHTLAARWIYSLVPYDDWSRALFGTSVSELFGWERNHFDRLVHFAYGLLIAPALCIVLRRGRSFASAALLAVNLIVSTGALYELLEWGIAIALSPEAAEAYNGQQGDLWDAQKDMALALLGAIIGVGVLAAVTARRRSSADPAGSRAGR